MQNQACNMSTLNAEQLLASCGAGYVRMGHPDIAVATAIVGYSKAMDILKSKTCHNDAFERRVAGCCGAKNRH